VRVSCHSRNDLSSAYRQTTRVAPVVRCPSSDDAKHIDNIHQTRRKDAHRVRRYTASALHQCSLMFLRLASERCRWERSSWQAWPTRRHIGRLEFKVTLSTFQLCSFVLVCMGPIVYKQPKKENLTKVLALTKSITNGNLAKSYTNLCKRRQNFVLFIITSRLVHSLGLYTHFKV